MLASGLASEGGPSGAPGTCVSPSVPPRAATAPSDQTRAALPGGEHALIFRRESNGILLIAQEEPHAELVGLDFSPNMLEQARVRCANMPGLVLVQGDAQELPFETIWRVWQPRPWRHYRHFLKVLTATPCKMLLTWLSATRKGRSWTNQCCKPIG